MKIKKDLGQPTNVGELKKMIAHYPDDMAINYKNMPVLWLVETTFKEEEVVPDMTLLVFEEREKMPNDWDLPLPADYYTKKY